MPNLLASSILPQQIYKPGNQKLKGQARLTHHDPRAKDPPSCSLTPPPQQDRGEIG